MCMYMSMLDFMLKHEKKCYNPGARSASGIGVVSILPLVSSLINLPIVLDRYWHKPSQEVLQGLQTTVLRILNGDMGTKVMQ